MFSVRYAALVCSTTLRGQSSGSASRYLVTVIFVPKSLPCPMEGEKDSSCSGTLPHLSGQQKSASRLACDPCQTTNTSSECFLAVIGEIAMDNLTSHPQVYPYLESCDFIEYVPALDQEFTLSTLVAGLLGNDRYRIERSTLDCWRGVFCDPALVNLEFTSFFSN